MRDFFTPRVVALVDAYVALIFAREEFRARKSLGAFVQTVPAPINVVAMTIHK